MQRAWILNLSFALCVALLALTGCPKSSALDQTASDQDTTKKSTKTGTKVSQADPPPARREEPAPRPEPAKPKPRAGAVNLSQTPEEMFEEGVKVAANDPKGALQRFKVVVQKKPSSYQAWYNIGVLQDRQGNLPQSEVAYRKALNHKPDFYPAVINIARLYLRQNRKSQALMLLQSKANSYPKDLRFRNALIYLYIRNGQLSRAESEARRIQKQDEKNVQAIINLGLVWYKQSKFELSRTAFNIASQTAPKLAVPQYYLGCVTHKLKDTNTAIEHLQKAVTLQDSYPEAHNLLGVLFLKQGKVDKAHKHFKKATEYMPNMWDARLNLGISLAELKRYNEAVKIYKKLLQDNAYYIEAHYHLGILYLDRKIPVPRVRSQIAIPASIQGSKRIVRILDTLARLGKSVQHLNTYVNRKSGLAADAPARKYLEDAKKKQGREQKRLQRTIKSELRKLKRRRTKRATPPRPRPRTAAPKADTKPKK